MIIEDQGLHLEENTEKEVDLLEKIVDLVILKKEDVLVVEREAISREIVLKKEEARDHLPIEININTEEAIEEKEVKVFHHQEAEAEMTREAREEAAAEVLVARERAIALKDVIQKEKKEAKVVNILNKLELTNKVYL